MSLAQLYNLQPADVLITPKSDVRMIKHFVVFEYTDIYGTDHYLENKRGHGVRRIDGATFERENTILDVRKFEGDDYERELAISRGVALLGRPYDLSKFNCEHFANCVQYNTPVSPQFDNFMEGLETALKIAAVTTILVGIASLMND